MSIPHHETGRLGEQVGALLLASRGFRIVARNLRFGRRELDLVVERGRLLVAVEVKWRRGDDAAALAAWSRAQRVRAREAVLAAMESIPDGARRPWRFDLVTIRATPRGWSVEHHPGVWSPGDSFW